MNYGSAGMNGHYLNNPYFGNGHYGGNPHKYGYVPNGTWGGNQPYPLSSKERENWEAHLKDKKGYQSVHDGPQ